MPDEALPTKGELIALVPGTLRWDCTCGRRHWAIGKNIGARILWHCTSCGDTAFYFPPEDL